MSADHEAVERLLASISDGAAMDWDNELLQSPPLQRSQVQALRDISSIAEFNRVLQRGGDAVGRTESTALRQWGHLTLLDQLGAGSQAEVHRAWDSVLQREVALKLSQVGATAASEDALLREGRAAARLKHPNVVTVHGIDRHDGMVGMWMELVRGESLERLVSGRSPLPIADVQRLARELTSALAAVHDAGLLHADLKPANVVRDADGRFVLTDFGLGRRQWQGAGDLGPSGTPMYMAPELFSGAAASERSDLYSLGLALWFALAGRHPFDSTSLAGLIEDAKRGPAAKLAALRPDAPSELVALIGRAIAPVPESRFGSAREMSRVLEAAEPHAIAARPSAKRGGRAQLLVLTVLAAIASVVAVRLIQPKLDRRELVVTPAPTAASIPAGAYTVEASFLKRTADQAMVLANGDRVRPGDRLSLSIRTSRASYVYVLNEDEQGERFLLFPQPRFDTRNPLRADSAVTLPGAIGETEQAWTVTSAGGREHFLVVVSPEPVAELEAELGSLKSAAPDRAIEYARIGGGTMELLRGVGGVTELPAQTAQPARRSGAFEKFRSLAGRENAVSGIWVRQFVLENPSR